MRTRVPAPASDRSLRRLAAEQDWRRLADRRAVDVFRLAGIYGPGRSAFDDLRAGTARRISKPGHTFGRIHRDDIVRAVMAAMRQDRASGVRVLQPCRRRTRGKRRRGGRGGTAARRRLARAACRSSTRWPTMSPMARSFWAENRKVSQPANAADARPALALSELSRGTTRHPGRGARRASGVAAPRSCGRDSRWSPSFTSDHLDVLAGDPSRRSAAPFPRARRDRPGRAAGAPDSRARSARSAAAWCARPRSARA